MGLRDGIWCSDHRRPKGGFWLSPQFHAWTEMEFLDLEAIGVFVSCGSWATEYNHPQLYPHHARMYDFTKRSVSRLTAADLWTESDDFYRTKMLAELRLREGCRGRVMLMSRLLRLSQEILYAGNPGLGLWALAGSWSLVTSKPGFIPAHMAKMFGTPRTIRDLADSELWLKEPSGYAMNNSLFSDEALWAVGRDDERTPIPPDVRERVYERDGWACVSCKSTEDLSLDHIYPWSLGGSDDEDNLQTLCKPCNSRKGARVLWGAAWDSCPHPYGATRRSRRSPRIRSGCTCCCYPSPN